MPETPKTPEHKSDLIAQIEHKIEEVMGIGPIDFESSKDTISFYLNYGSELDDINFSNLIIDIKKHIQTILSNIADIVDSDFYINPKVNLAHKTIGLTIRTDGAAREPEAATHDMIPQVRDHAVAFLRRAKLEAIAIQTEQPDGCILVTEVTPSHTAEVGMEEFANVYPVVVQRQPASEGGIWLITKDLSQLNRMPITPEQIDPFYNSVPERQVYETSQRLVQALLNVGFAVSQEYDRTRTTVILHIEPAELSP